SCPASGRGQVALVAAALPVTAPEDTISSQHVPLPVATRGAPLKVGGGALWIATYGQGGGGGGARWRLHPLARQQRYRLAYLEFGNDVTFGYGAAWIPLGAPANAV